LDSSDQVERRNKVFILSFLDREAPIKQVFGLFGLFNSRNRFSPDFPAYLAMSVRWTRVNPDFPAYLATSARWTRFSPVYPVYFSTSARWTRFSPDFPAWSRDSSPIDWSLQSGKFRLRRDGVVEKDQKCEQKGQAGGAEKRSVRLCLWVPTSKKIESKEPKDNRDRSPPACTAKHPTDIQHQGPLE
jgi:hypothetical protein